MHRLHAVVDRTVPEEPTELADDLRLVGAVQRAVDGGPARGAGVCSLLSVARSHNTPRRRNSSRWMSMNFSAYSRHAARTCRALMSAFFDAELLVHAVFDGQAVAVPSGNVVRVVPHHGPGLDHDVLEDLVQRLAEMDMSVGVGRPVMEDVRFRLRAAVPDAVEHIDRRPPVQRLRLPVREPGLHGEPGFRQVDRAFKFKFRRHLAHPA